jgi:hypothetical protein
VTSGSPTASRSLIFCLGLQPYVVFTLGGEKVFKSQVKKKTLAPTWNERFEAVVPSRFNSIFTFEIFDWNQVRMRLGPPLRLLTADTVVLASPSDRECKIARHGIHRSCKHRAI